MGFFLIPSRITCTFLVDFKAFCSTMSFGTFPDYAGTFRRATPAWAPCNWAVAVRGVNGQSSVCTRAVNWRGWSSSNVHGPLRRTMTRTAMSMPRATTVCPAAANVSGAKVGANLSINHVLLGTNHMAPLGGATSKRQGRPKTVSLLLVAPPGGAMCFVPSWSVRVFFWNPNRIFSFLNLLFQRETNAAHQRVKTTSEPWQNWVCARRKRSPCVPCTSSKSSLTANYLTVCIFYSTFFYFHLVSYGHSFGIFKKEFFFEKFWK